MNKGSQKIYKIQKFGLTLSVPLTGLLILISSCQKIVNIDLNETSPKLVIEGVITDSLGPYTVRLSKTGSYYNQPVLPPVSGAFVLISDNAGTIDTLKEKLPGLYFTSKIQGIPGRTYVLKVISENKEYAASSAMHSHVEIDSLSIETTDRFTRRFSDSKTKSIGCQFKDPADEKNYYRTKFFENGIFNSDNYRLYDDQYTNGEEIDLRVGRSEAGDTDLVELISIDQPTYDYYRTLEDILRVNPIFGSTPANPNTNLSNGALGYFAAYAISKKSIIIPEK